MSSFVLSALIGGMIFVGAGVLYRFRRSVFRRYRALDPENLDKAERLLIRRLQLSFVMLLLGPAICAAVFVATSSIDGQVFVAITVLLGVVPSAFAIYYSVALRRVRSLLHATGHNED
jgi:hypothetical protein